MFENNQFFSSLLDKRKETGFRSAAGLLETTDGQIFKRTDSINTDSAPWLPSYPGNVHSAHTGEKMPIAKIPEGVEFRAGKGSSCAGKAGFYRLRYDPSLIAMNTSKKKSFSLSAPAAGQATELVSGKIMMFHGPLKIGSRATAVFYLGH